MYGRRCSLIVGGKEAAGSCFTSLAAVRGGMGKHCPHQRGLASVMSLFELIGAVPPRCIRACAGRGSCALALVLALARLGLSKSLSSSELTAPTAHCAAVVFAPVLLGPRLAVFVPVLVASHWRAKTGNRPQGRTATRAPLAPARAARPAPLSPPPPLNSPCAPAPDRPRSRSRSRSRSRPPPLPLPLPPSAFRFRGSSPAPSP
jgi:hypothetical protein